MLTVIGEALIDEVVRPGAEPVPHVGGSPMNVAVGLARLGHPVQFLGRYGSDHYGQLISTHLRTNSVLLPWPADQAPSSVARAELDESGAADYQFELSWILPRIEAGLLQGSTLLHTGSIAAMLEPGVETVKNAVLAARGHATISYDPNYRPSIIGNVEYAREWAEKFVSLADVVKASDEDLAALYPGAEPLDSARSWLKRGPAVVVVTRGVDGPWAVSAAGEAQCVAPATRVADTVGAGDSFMSALLSAIVDRELDGAQRREQLAAISVQQLHEILQFAAAAAAITVTRPGANPPSREELRGLGLH
ncbi:carbohydrate kinase family protein [Psychromicrobium lacuslunae]|uniref:Ribokinase n=1 Tax=Psychromicrobium lacuslunae TaxID=1618207 RepID=A0A0D4C159_9MICC|nr:carbohydrate kinase [Psychromicrobium lacuslunae]AJT42328.1 ribokinase [Psychromicrobium lacuslunae]